MNTKQIAKIGLGISALWLGILRGAKALIVMLNGYDIKNIDILNLSATLTLRFYIKNPLFIGITLKSIEGDIYLNGTKVGFINNHYDYYLAGARSHVIPVSAVISGAEILKSIFSDLNAGIIKGKTVSFDGKITVGKYNIPIPVQITKKLSELKK